MGDCKIGMILFFLFCYTMYHVQVWTPTEEVDDKNSEESNKPSITIPEVEPNKTELKSVGKKKATGSIKKGTCQASEVFTIKSHKKVNRCQQLMDHLESMEYQNNLMFFIAVMTLLLMCIMTAAIDVLNAKEEEEKARKKLNGDGDRKKSLAEFANKKMLRRESSKLGNQLLAGSSNEDNVTQNENKPSTSSNEPSSEPKLVAMPSAAKLIGARPAPMLRRSSFPALPPNPNIQALMMNKRLPSFDSDDDCDGRGRRVRIIRRF